MIFAKRLFCLAGICPLFHRLGLLGMVLLALAQPGRADVTAVDAPAVPATAAAASPALPGLGDLPPLQGPVILTVTGLDPELFPGGSLAFDGAMLRALGTETITTSSIWTDGKHSFTGVPLARMTAFLHAEGARLSLHALNDYVIEFPAPLPGARPDATAPESDLAPILAFEMDGAPMPVRDKGPVWIIYPYDDNAIYRTDTVYARSVWQLDRIDVLR